MDDIIDKGAELIKYNITTKGLAKYVAAGATDIPTEIISI